MPLMRFPLQNMQTGYSRNFARVELEMTPKGAGELAAGPHVVNQFPVEVGTVRQWYWGHQVK